MIISIFIKNSLTSEFREIIFKQTMINPLLLLFSPCVVWSGLVLDHAGY